MNHVPRWPWMALVLCVLASGCTRHDYADGNRYNLDHGNTAAAKRVPADAPTRGEQWVTSGDPEAFGEVRGGGPAPGSQLIYPGSGD